jgi:hypothetical protein
MKVTNNDFRPIDYGNGYIHGVYFQRADGINVEVVRCYANDWNVFLTRNGNVVARSIDEYRRCGNGYLRYTSAMKIARLLAK